MSAQRYKGVSRCEEGEEENLQVMTRGADRVAHRWS